MVVLAGLLVKLRGLLPVLVPPPLFRVTEYGGVPPLIVTVTTAALPGQTVPPPLTTALMLGQTIVIAAVVV